MTADDEKAVIFSLLCGEPLAVSSMSVSQRLRCLMKLLGCPDIPSQWRIVDGGGSNQMPMHVSELTFLAQSRFPALVGCEYTLRINFLKTESVRSVTWDLERFDNP